MTYDTHNNDRSSLEQLNRIKPGYLAAYGLTDAPFSRQHDDRFFYSNAELTERLELLKHYTQYGNLLLIITGERGIGKSSLKQHFISAAPEEWRICEIQAHTMMDASLLLRQAAVGFGISEPPLEPSWLYDILSSQLEQLHQESSVPILIIDDAHELPKDALQSLLYLAEHHSDPKTALRIILFCEPEIETMLEDPAIHSLKERVTHNMEIPSLNETQTAEYLRHRLAVAGLDGTSPFTPKLIHKIYKASEGIPSKINKYAHQNLLDDSEPVHPEEMDLNDELFQPASSFNLRNMLLGGFALITIVSVLLFQDQINSLFEEPEPLTAKIKVQQNQSKDKESTITTQPTKEKTIEFSLNDDTSLNDSQDKKVTQQTKPTVNTNKKENVLKLSAINSNPIYGSKQRQIISISGSGFHERQKVKVSWTGNEKILNTTQVNVSSDTYINLILNVGMQADTWKVTIIDPLDNTESNTISFNVIEVEKETTAVKQKKSPGKTGTSKLTNALYGENWIKQQNKNHFTLQLLGSHQQSTLRPYLKKFALKNDAAMFKTIRNDKEWFTLIYGTYSTKSAAQAAAKQLPKGMAQPWIRSFASILPSIKEKNTAKNIKTNISSNQEGWLWSQDPRHYTLQLAAGTDKKAIQTFIKQHSLYGKAVYFHRLRDGKDWYILIHGNYSTFAKAKQAISQLPLAIQKAKPWARQFSAIHAELN